ncbi:MAG TPA: outer membrane beta-barrel family protein [Chitinophagaceae bacterium]|nr:outer membrane beta-barrel family protein [Chitinophagaceae bacterium]
MRKTLLLLFSVLCFCIAGAQNASIKGIVTDTVNRQNLPNTSVSLLRAKDSIMEGFARCNTNGAFTIKGIAKGDYILLITYPHYVDYADRITITDSAQVLNMGSIDLILKANLLQEVIVKQQLGSIRLKGDTTEFIADSFKVQPNATVEDLLKVIPGIQVDKNGKITAQGETVKKVLVDGEEFFGDDPTLVTQNLRADMVGAVQLYDKKSDQAAFTGIDDGKSEKTINIKLKDGKKNGYFGKVNLGGATHGYYDNQLMANIFKNKEKFAAYGIVSNIGKTGLNWEEAGSYGDNPLSSASYDEQNGYFSINGSYDELDSWTGNYEGQGNPRVQTGGLHYNNKWNDDKQAINGNYKILHLNVDGQGSNTSQTILHDTVYYNSQNSRFSNYALRNKANAYYELQIDSSSSVKIFAEGATTHKTSNTFNESEERFTDSSLVNQNSRALSSISDNKSINSNILWRKKFKKKGRTMSFNLGENYTSSNSTGYLNSTTNFFSKGNPSGNLVTDQYKVNSSQNTGFNTKLTYSEPLSKYASLVFNYGVIINNSTSIRSSYNKDAGGKYTDFDSIYSNNYKFNVLIHRGGAAYIYNRKKLRISAGNDMSYTSFTQTDVHADTSVKRSFVNWNPQSNITLQFSQQRRLSLRYNGYTNQPSIEQIQPVHVNDDPLNITIGNPALKPSFSNYMSLYYYDYKVLKERDISFNASYDFVQNDITNKSAIDTGGKTVTQYVNINGNHRLRLDADYGIKIKKWDIGVGFNAGYSRSRNQNFYNGLLNITDGDNYTGGLYLNKRKENKYSFSLSGSATYTNSVSSVQTGLKTKYWSYELQPFAEVFLPLKIQIHAEGDYTIRQNTTVFQGNNNVFLLNAWIAKKFLKNDALQARITGNDILNQNLGIFRSVSSNVISQSTNTTIRRYFMFSLIWNFNKAGTKTPGND